MKIYKNIMKCQSPKKEISDGAKETYKLQSSFAIYIAIVILVVKDGIKKWRKKPKIILHQEIKKYKSLKSLK